MTDPPRGSFAFQYEDEITEPQSVARAMVVSEPRSRAPRPLSRGDRVGGWTLLSVSQGDPMLAVCRDGAGRTGFAEISALGPVAIASAGRLAALLRRFDHPALPRLLDSGLDRRRKLLWVVVEPFDGETLAALLGGGALPWTDACRILGDVAQGLAALHGEDVVHGRLAPTAILVGRDLRTRLVALHGAGTAEDLARSGAARPGMLAYEAPEVSAGEPWSATSDVYAFGAMLYESLVGRPPGPAAVRAATVHPRDREALDPGDAVPAWLRVLVLRTTDPNPRRRMADMRAVARCFEAAAPVFRPVAEWPTEVPPPPRVAMPRAREEAPPAPAVSRDTVMAVALALFVTGAGIVAALESVSR